MTTPHVADPWSARRAAAEDVVRRAHALIDALDAQQRSAVLRAATFDEASRWHNLPQSVLTGMGRERRGLATATLDDRQWGLVRDLLAAAMGSSPGRGADQVAQHLRIDDHLRDIGGPWGYGRGEFVLAFLGEPSASTRWLLQLGGHHLAITHTYDDGLLVGATPAFRGIEPDEETVVHGRPTQPLRVSQSAVAALVAALDAAHRETTRLGEAVDELVLRPGEEWRFDVPARGALVGDLDPAVAALVLAVVASYVENVAAPDAAAILDCYREELPATRVAYTGSRTGREVGDYLRIDGPSVWIEWSTQGGVVLDGPHPHSVWRDKRDDYGGLRP